MEWWMWAIIVMGIIGAVMNSSEKEKKRKAAEQEVATRKQRAEDARAAILASGDQEMINRLRLMEATAQGGTNAAAAQMQPASAMPSLVGTAAAVTGGIVVGNAITGAVQMAALETALQDVLADLEQGGHLGDSDLAGLDDAGEADGSDLDFG